MDTYTYGTVSGARLHKCRLSTLLSQNLSSAPLHKKWRPYLLFTTIVKLLKEANERADKMQDEKDYWYRCHHDLYQDYIALKFSDICDECKVKEESIKSDELILCQHCKEGRQTLQSPKIDLAKKEELIRYWQDCYET